MTILFVVLKFHSDGGIVDRLKGIWGYLRGIWQQQDTLGDFVRK